MANYKINLSQLPQKTFGEIESQLNSYLELGRAEVKKHQPEDTFELTDSVKVRKAQNIGNGNFEGFIYADQTSPSIRYAEYVEFGVPSGAPRRYHKNGGRKKGDAPFIISSDGVQAYSKAKKYLENLNTLNVR